MDLDNLLTRSDLTYLEVFFFMFSLSICAQDSHLLRVTIPDAASIQFNLLMMSM